MRHAIRNQITYSIFKRDIIMFEHMTIRLRSGSAVIRHNTEIFHIHAGDLIYLPAYYDYYIQSEQEELLIINFEAFQVSDACPKELFIFTPHNPDYLAELFTKSFPAQDPHFQAPHPQLFSLFTNC